MMKHRIFRILFTVLLLSLMSVRNAKAANGESYYQAHVTAYTVQRTGTLVYGGYGGTVKVKGYYTDNEGYSSEETNYTGTISGNVSFTMTATPADGYDFSGWFNEANGSTAVSSDREYTRQYSAGSSRGSANRTNYDIYAKFSPIQYTISFAANGGSGTGPANISYNIESTDKVFPACPYTRAGYDFSGWKPADDVGNWKTTDSYSASQTVSQKWGNVTLNAQWTPKEYTITYDADGGTLSSSGNQTYTIESTDALKTASKTGYTFAGWKVTQVDSSEGNWTVGETAVSPLNGKYGNVTLKAQWEKADITITISGLAEGDTIMLKIKKDDVILYTVPITGKASGSSSVTIKDLPTGSGYSVSPVQGWNFAYDQVNFVDTFGLSSSGASLSYTVKKKTSVKKYDEKSEVNWKL